MKNEYTSKPVEHLFADENKESIENLTNAVANLKKLPKSLHIDGKQIALSSKYPEVIHIYKTIIAALQSNYYNSQSEVSKKSIAKIIRTFLSWLNSIPVTTKNRFSIIKDYEAYRVNQHKVKPQSTGIRFLLSLFREGILTDVIETETMRYVNLLVESTTPSLADPREAYTLTGYFASMPWLREAMVEKDYLRLESPRILMDSFSIAIATTLLLIIDAKKSIGNNIKSVQFEEQFTDITTKKERLYRWCHLIYSETKKHDQNNANYKLLETLMTLDFLKEHLPKKRGILNTYRIPCIFHPSYIKSPSPIEELLCSWLCAWQAIQPSDIGKLKKNNFIIGRNNQGKPNRIQCAYYKGRSGREYESPLLEANSVEGLAILSYLDFLPVGNLQLFTNLKSFRLSFTERSSPSFRLLKLLKCKLVRNEIMENVNARNSSDIFTKAFISMAENGGECLGVWQKDEYGVKRSMECYRREVKYYLPSNIFYLAHIKNSSVHARTDMYRDGDLVNQNSHTSLTEKVCYLTDDNNEWKNQNGRISRLVLNDFSDYIYKPSLQYALQAANDIKIRTKTARATGADNITINTLGQVTSTTYDFNAEPDEIIVLDTPATVVNMLHYIAEAERQYIQLLENAPFFFESSVLPLVEWMHFVLEQKIDPSTVKKGLKSYNKIRDILPALFSAELNAGVTA